MPSVTHARRRLLLAVLAATAIAPTVTGIAPTATATAAPPLADVPFAVATDGLFDEARNDGRQGEPGRWELLRGGSGADALRLTFRIEPPPVGLAVQSGPAVLFGGLHLFGDAGGDMATGLWVDSFTAVTLAPCADAGCQYTTEIALPIHDLAPAIRRLEPQGRLMWVSAELTLVRTFGGGSWLQVLPFMFGGSGPLEAAAGRLGAIGKAAGTMFPYGLFPSEQASRVPADPHLLPAGFDYGADVERRRLDAGDSSLPLATAPGLLRVSINPPCKGPYILTLHDEVGDRILDVPLDGLRNIEKPLPIPVGVPWWLTLHDGGGIDFDQGRRGSGVRIGPIGTTEPPIAVDAAFDCSVPRGVVRVDGAIVAASEAAPTVAVANGPGPLTSPGESRAVPRLDVSAAPSSATPGVLVVAAAALLLLLGSRTRKRHR
jgi:hypothetical protein